MKPALFAYIAILHATLTLIVAGATFGALTIENPTRQQEQDTFRLFVALIVLLAFGGFIYGVVAP